MSADARSLLAAYLDTVSDALTDTGIGVRFDAADDAAMQLEIDLEPTVAGRRPVMVWTVAAGWRIGLAADGVLWPDSIRYVHAGPVPSPAYVAEQVTAWLKNPRSLTDVAPAYVLPSQQLVLALAASVEQDGDDL